MFQYLSFFWSILEKLVKTINFLILYLFIEKTYFSTIGGGNGLGNCPGIVLMSWSPIRSNLGSEAPLGSKDLKSTSWSKNFPLKKYFIVKQKILENTEFWLLTCKFGAGTGWKSFLGGCTGAGTKLLFIGTGGWDTLSLGAKDNGVIGFWLCNNV